MLLDTTRTNYETMQLELIMQQSRKHIIILNPIPISTLIYSGVQVIGLLIAATVLNQFAHRYNNSHGSELRKFNLCR